MFDHVIDYSTGILTILLCFYVNTVWTEKSARTNYHHQAKPNDAS